MRPANPLELAFITAAGAGNIAEMTRLLTISSDAYRAAYKLEHTPEPELELESELEPRLKPGDLCKHGAPPEYELNLNARHPDYGYTALGAAAENGQTAVVQFLLSKKPIKLDIKKFRDEVPGSERRWGSGQPGQAAGGTEKAQAEEKAEEQCDSETIIIDPYVDTPALHGRTPLGYAARNNHLATVQALLERGAYVCPLLQQLTGNQNIKSILKQYAVIQKEEDAEAKADRLHRYLHQATIDDDQWTIHALVRAGADPSLQLINHVSPAVLAAHLGNTDAMLALLANGGGMAHQLDGYEPHQTAQYITRQKHPWIYAVTRPPVFWDLESVRGQEEAATLISKAVCSAICGYGADDVQERVLNIVQTLPTCSTTGYIAVQQRINTLAVEQVILNLVRKINSDTMAELMRLSGYAKVISCAVKAANGDPEVVKKVVIAAKHPQTEVRAVIFAVEEAVIAAVKVGNDELAAVEAAVIAGGRTPEVVETAVNAAGGTPRAATIAMRAAGCIVSGDGTERLTAYSSAASTDGSVYGTANYLRHPLIGVMREFITDPIPPKTPLPAISTGKLAAMCMIIARPEEPLARIPDDNLDALIEGVRIASLASLNARTALIETRAAWLVPSDALLHATQAMLSRDKQTAEAVRRMVRAAGGGPAAVTAALRAANLAALHTSRPKLRWSEAAAVASEQETFKYIEALRERAMGYRIPSTLISITEVSAALQSVVAAVAASDHSTFAVRAAVHAVANSGIPLTPDILIPIMRAGLDSLSEVSYEVTGNPHCCVMRPVEPLAPVDVTHIRSEIGVAATVLLASSHQPEVRKPIVDWATHAGWMSAGGPRPAEGFTPAIRNIANAVDLYSPKSPPLNYFKAFFNSLLPKLYQESAFLKRVDAAAKTAKFYLEPTGKHAREALVSGLHWWSMHSSVGMWSVTANTLAVVWTYQDTHSWTAALQCAADAAVFVALGALIAEEAPVLAAAYGIAMTAFAGYQAVTSVYSVLISLFDPQAKLDAYEAWRYAAYRLAWMTGREFFAAKAEECSAAIKAIKFDIELQEEHTLLQAKHGQVFGDKIFAHISKPLLELRAKLKDAGLENTGLKPAISSGAFADPSALTDAEADELVASNLISIPDADYELCRLDSKLNPQRTSANGATLELALRPESALRPELKSSTALELDGDTISDSKHYYCVHLVDQSVHHVAIAGDGAVKVLEIF